MPWERSRVLWLGIGVALVAGALGADLVGLAGGPDLGLRQLAVTLVGLALIAAAAWQRAAPVTGRQAFLLWAWWGLVCGTADAALLALRRNAFGELIHRTHHYVWMMPASYLALFAAVGAGFALATRLLPARLTLPVVVFTPGLFVVWSITRQFDWLQDLAALALTVGVATGIGRAAAARPAALQRFAVISISVLLTATLALSIALPVADRWSARRAVAALPAAPAGAPNVVLIVLDTVRADHLGCYGYGRDTTPAIDRLAAAGTAFDLAFATAPWTLTSHASLFTGRDPHQLDADWLVPLGADPPTLAERLAAYGYATGGFVGNLYYCAAENGIARGFARYDDYLIEPLVLATCSTFGREVVSKITGEPATTLLRNGADTVTTRCLEWIEGLPDDRPFFAFVNYFDAHAMYIAPSPYDERYGPRSPNLWKLRRRGWRWSAWSEREAAGFVNAYDGCLRFIDDQIERLIAGLRRRGVLEDTLLVITTDHGELFGEHDLMEHGNSLYRPLLQAPLIWHWPGRIPAAQRVATPVSLVDVPATILDLVGAPAARRLPGVSMVGQWTGGDGAAPPSPLLSSVTKGVRRHPRLPVSKGDMASLLRDGLHYIRNGDGSVELYALEDTAEAHNLAATRPADADRMRRALEQALRR